MMEPVLINSPSLANCNLLELGDNVDELVRAGVRFLHIDLMDGHYVPNLCFPIRVLSDIKEKYPDIITDVHLMAIPPEDYVQRLADAGADYLSFHIDSTRFTIRTLNAIKNAGMKGGVVINPSQGTDSLLPFIDLVDMVTVMAVEPGFAGQRFMERTVPRILDVARMRKQKGLDFLINVDGAINYPNVIPCVHNGANVFVTGIYTVFKQPDGITSACRRFEDELRKGEALGFDPDVY